MKISHKLIDDWPGSQEKELLDEQSTVNQPHQFFHVQAAEIKQGLITMCQEKVPD